MPDVHFDHLFKAHHARIVLQSNYISAQKVNVYETMAAALEDSYFQVGGSCLALL